MAEAEPHELIITVNGDQRPYCMGPDHGWQKMTVLDVKNTMAAPRNLNLKGNEVMTVTDSVNNKVLKDELPLPPGVNRIHIEVVIPPSKEEQERQQYNFLKKNLQLRSCVVSERQETVKLFLKHLRMEKADTFEPSLRAALHQLCHGGDGLSEIVSTELGRWFVVALFKTEEKRSTTLVVEAVCEYMVHSASDASFYDFWSPMEHNRRVYAKMVKSWPDQKIEALLTWISSRAEMHLNVKSLNCYRFLRFLAHCLENSSVCRVSKKRGFSGWWKFCLPEYVFGEAYMSEWNVPYGIHLLRVFVASCAMDSETQLRQFELVPSLVTQLAVDDREVLTQMIVSVSDKQSKNLEVTRYIFGKLLETNRDLWFDVVNDVEHRLSAGQLGQVYECIGMYLEFVLSGAVIWNRETEQSLAKATGLLSKSKFQAEGKQSNLLTLARATNGETRVCPELFNTDVGVELFSLLAQDYMTTQEVLQLVGAQDDAAFMRLWIETNMWLKMMSEESRAWRPRAPVTEFVMKRLSVILASGQLSKLQDLTNISPSQSDLVSAGSRAVVSDHFSRAGGADCLAIVDLLRVPFVTRAVEEHMYDWDWTVFRVSREEYIRFSTPKLELFRHLVKDLFPLADAGLQVSRLWDVLVVNEEGRRLIRDVLEREAVAKSGCAVMRILSSMLLRGSGRLLVEVVGKANEEQLDVLMFEAWMCFQRVLDEPDACVLDNVVTCIRNERTHRVGHKYFCSRAVCPRVLSDGRFGSYLTAVAGSYVRSGEGVVATSRGVDPAREHKSFWMTVLSKESIEMLLGGDRSNLFAIIAAAPLRPFQIEVVRRLNKVARTEVEDGFWADFDARFGYLLLSDGMKEFSYEEHKGREGKSREREEHFMSVPLSAWTSRHFVEWAQSKKWPKKLQGSIDEILRAYMGGSEREIGHELANIEDWEHYGLLSANSMMLERFSRELQKLKAALPAATAGDARLLDLGPDNRDFGDDRKDEEDASLATANQSMWVWPSWRPWSSASATTRVYGQRPIGFRNLGSTCFMNSGLQCVLQTPWLIPYIVRETYGTRPGVSKKLFDAFAALAHQMHHVDNGERGSVQRYHDALAQCNSLYSTYRQLDAFESVQILLDALHKTLNVAVNPRGRVPLAHDHQIRLAGADVGNIEVLAGKLSMKFAEYERALQMRDHSVVTELVQGASVLVEHCQKCAVTVCSFETWKHVDIMMENVTGTGQAFKKALEQMNEAHLVDWVCPSCRGREAVQDKIFYHAPPVLFVRVCRFSTAGSPGTSKISDTLVYPKEMEMDVFGGERIEYTLHAVCLHMGSSIVGGHYVADVKSLVTGKWYRVNDSSVYEMDSFSAPRGQEVMLVYSRRL